MRTLPALLVEYVALALQASLCRRLPCLVARVRLPDGRAGEVFSLIDEITKRCPLRDDERL